MFDKVIYWCGFRYELKKVLGSEVATYAPNDENVVGDTELRFTKNSFDRFVKIGYIQRSER